MSTKKVTNILPLKERSNKKIMSIKKVYRQYCHSRKWLKKKLCQSRKWPKYCHPGKRLHRKWCQSRKWVFYTVTFFSHYKPHPSRHEPEFCGLSELCISEGHAWGGGRDPKKKNLPLLEKDQNQKISWVQDVGVFHMITGAGFRITYLQVPLDEDAVTVIYWYKSNQDSRITYQ